MTVRIIAGHFRGKRLTTPAESGAASPVRPTGARVREAAFNILGARINWPEVTVLDLFCGSGAYGLEALSRGAATATFVDTDTRWASENIKNCAVAAQSTTVRADATRYTPVVRPDVIFADPPYGTDQLQTLLSRADEIAAPTTLWLIETAAGQPLDTTGFTVLKQQKYGKSVLTLLQKA